MNIYDIAQRANVSIATVSRVLNGSDRVKPETRDRIQQIIEDCGFNRYDPHARRKACHAIAILCVSLGTPETAYWVEKVTAGLADHGYRTLLSCTGGDYNSLHIAMEHLREHVDAFVLDLGSFTDLPATERSYLIHAARRKPLVLINEKIDSSGIHNILYDQPGALEAFVVDSIKKGKEHILFLFHSLSDYHMKLLTQYQEAYQLNHLEPESIYMHICPDRDAAFAYVAELRSRNTPLDLVITTCSELSHGVAKALLLPQPCPEISVHTTECRDSVLFEAILNSLLALIEHKDSPSQIVIPGRIV